MGDWLFIKDKKGIYKDKKEWMGLWRVMGVVGIGGFWDFGGRIGAGKGVCGGRGVDGFCLTAAEMWMGFINGSRSVDIFINGSRATVSTAAAGFVFMGFGWAAEQPYISFLVVKMR